MWQPRNDAELRAADRAEEFIGYLTHTKGRWAGLPFSLLPWQRQIIRPTFGTLGPCPCEPGKLWRPGSCSIHPDGVRVIRTVYAEIPKKQGKSELAAAVALLLLFGDREPGGEIYGAASDRDQASIVFNVAAQMVRKSPVLSKRARVIDYSKRIVVTKGVSEGSVYRAIPADVAGSHGFNVSGVVFDEIAVQPNRELWDVLTDGTAARTQPLTFGITTAGYDRNSICWELHEHARQVIEGTVQDQSWHGVIFGAEENADWQDPEIWKKVNPSFGITVPESFYETKAQQAEISPAYENDFRRQFLNQWVSQYSRFIPMKEWDRNAKLVDEAALTNKRCFGGLDLSSTTDLTALALVFPGPNKETDPFQVVMRFWTPENRLAERSKRDRVDYQHWADQGLLNITEGDVVDYGAVEREIQKASLKFRLPKIGIDRLFNSEYLSQRVQEYGIEVERKGQGYLDMSWPTKEVLKLILQLRLLHGGHPILRWMADNLMVETDAAGNVKPSKAKSTQRIDGIPALVIALALATEAPEEYDILESVR